MKTQVWIIGSAWAWEYPEWWFDFNRIYQLAYDIWFACAKQWCIVVTGGKDWIMEWACKWWKDWWWMTVGVVRWAERGVCNPYVDVEVVTNMWHGWDAFLIPNMCDFAIVIGWWVWTLKEICGFYKREKPIFAMKWTWWRADKTTWTYLDERNLVKIVWCNSVSDLIELFPLNHTSHTHQS